MAGLYIFIILLFRVVQALFDKRSSLEIKNLTMLVGYNSFKNLISAVLGLILIFVGGVGFRLEPLTVLIATFSGISLFFSGYCGIYAMKSGTVSLSSMFGTAGMMIPIAAGALLFNKPVAPLQLAGLGLFFISAYLLIGASKSVYSNFSCKTLLMLLGSMVGNGCTMLAQQMFTTYVPNGNVCTFSFLSFGIIAVLSGVFYTVLSSVKKEEKEEKGTTKLSKTLMICGIALAVSVFVINQLATISISLVSPVILFTFINGGGTIISTLVAAIVYREKISTKTAFGIIIGIVSLVIIKMFE